MAPGRESSPPVPLSGRGSSPPVPLSLRARGNDALTGGEDGFPHDPDFPQLAIATDPARMLQVFRTHLVPAPGRRVEIEDCVPFRFRCRQATSRYVLQYTLRLVERTPGAERRWQQSVTGVIYAREGEAERQWQEGRAAEPDREIPLPWLAFEPVGFIPELAMLVELFPYDRKLRHLRLVMGGEGLAAAVDSRLLDGWEVQRRAIEPLRYRTELGAALRYTVEARQPATGERATRCCYLKVYRDDRGAATWRMLQRLSRPDATRTYDVVAPLAYFESLRTLAIEQAPGEPILSLLRDGHDPGTIMRPVARAVAAFNQDDRGIVTHAHTRVDQLDEVRRAAALVTWARPETRGDVAAVMAALEADLVDVSPAPLHRDLKADHVFLDGDRVIFIDLDSAALGDPVRDPAHLWAYLRGGVGLDAVPAARIRAAADAFVEEYFAHVPAAWRARFSLHCAGALVEVASGIFRRQEPAWRDKVITAVELARQALA
jgi:Ser/Thr protein kinase RdoA (MazF antagonist)